jgi:putative tryptophan/tyrosine transport system substrate-binding protein
MFVPSSSLHDPQETLAVHCGNGFDARFEPYQSTHLSRYNAGPRAWANMQRREFISLLGSAAVSCPLAAHAQQKAKLPIIGVMGAATPSVWAPWIAVFVQQLRERGWTEDRTVAIEYRWAEGHTERAAEIVAEFVRLKVDVILTSGTANVIAAKRATAIIPTVFVLVGDPVASGLVASLARPGGNVTGLSIQSPEVAGKRLEILREVIPGLRRLAIMANVGLPEVDLEMREVQAMATMLGLEIEPLEIRRVEDIALAFETLKGRANALYVVGDPLTGTNRVRINIMALTTRLPTMGNFREFVDAGGLMSYGANFPNQFRRAADYVDKILRGAKPGDIPVEQPTKFDLTVNLITAKGLGLDVPPTLLARADEVIE